MKNIMVCVTKQKTCQRLIDYGRDRKTSEEDQLFVIHVAGNNYSILNSPQEGEALEFLYQKAKEAGASLTVEKSDDVLRTLLDIVRKNQITEVIAGESGEQQGQDQFLQRFREGLKEQAELIVVPAAY